MLDNGNYQRPNLCVGRWNHWTGHWIGINLFRGVPCGLARLRIPRYTRERERDCHGPPPMPTFHDTRALASGFSLSLSDLTDLLANRMPFTVFTSVPISVYSLVGYRIRIRCDFYVHGKYQLVSCRSLFITGICDRACNVVRYFSLSRENF